MLVSEDTALLSLACYDDLSPRDQRLVEPGMLWRPVTKRPPPCWAWHAMTTCHQETSALLSLACYDDLSPRDHRLVEPGMLWRPVTKRPAPCWAWHAMTTCHQETSALLSLACYDDLSPRDHRLGGPAVWRPPSEREARTSLPAFPGRVIPVNDLNGVWRYGVSARTDWPGVSILWLAEIANLVCSLVSVWQHVQLSAQIHHLHTHCMLLGH